MVKELIIMLHPLFTSPGLRFGDQTKVSILKT